MERIANRIDSSTSGFQKTLETESCRVSDTANLEAITKEDRSSNDDEPHKIGRSLGRKKPPRQAEYRKCFRHPVSISLKWQSQIGT